MTESKIAEENAVILDVERQVYWLYYTQHMLWDQIRYFVFRYCSSAQTIPLMFMNFVKFAK